MFPWQDVTVSGLGGLRKIRKSSSQLREGGNITVLCLATGDKRWVLAVV